MKRFIEDNQREQKDRALKRLFDSFPTAYITLISILQSSLFGFLIFTASETFLSKVEDRDSKLSYEIDERYHEENETESGTKERKAFVMSLSEKFENLDVELNVVFRLLASFLFIVMMWNEYRIGSTLYRWIPTVYDALIPFGFAIFQAILIKFSVYERAFEVLWFAAMGILWLIGGLSYTNMNWQIKKERDANIGLYNINKGLLKMNPKIGFLGGLAFLLLFGVLWILHDYGTNDAKRAMVLLFSILTVVGEVAFIVASEMGWRRTVKSLKSDVLENDE